MTRMTHSTRPMRKIVHIDEEKCDGCGACVPSCAEGAIQVVDGKARLVAENLCDGLGNCLGTCPKDAIRIEERPADEFDEQAVEAHLAGGKAQAGGCPGAGARTLDRTDTAPASVPTGCPGTMMRKLQALSGDAPAVSRSAPSPPTSEPPAAASGASALGHWPVQLHLLPEAGDLWRDADVLLAADCTAYAMGDFHSRLLGGRTLAVACPKLDDTGAYVGKLARILAGNEVRSLTIARMEVPCCGGLEQIVRTAREQAGSEVPVEVVVISVRGEVLETRQL